MVFLLLTITVPAAVWWYLFRTDETEFHWAVIGWGVSVVALAAVLGNIDWTLWRFEGREGYAQDIIEKYSEGFGPGALLFAMGLGIAAAEFVRASREHSAQRPAEPDLPVPDPAPPDPAGAAEAAASVAEHPVAESPPSASTPGAPAVPGSAVAPSPSKRSGAHPVDSVIDPLANSHFDPLREQVLRTEARRAVAGSEELTRKLEAFLAQRDDLLRQGHAPELTTARELLARVFDS